jgi:hypothetical protein
MSREEAVVYSVPTHLEQREPFAFGRTVGEIAKLALIGYVAARLLGSEDLPLVLRVPAAGLVVLVGAGWALVRVQRRPLDHWLALAFRYGAMPRRRVWRPGPPRDGAEASPEDEGRNGGWYQLQRVRVRWVAPGFIEAQGIDGAANVPTMRRGAG